MDQDNMVINSEGKELSVKHLYTVEGYFTFRIRVKSGEFSGASNFCISKEAILLIIEKFTEMHKKLKGCCEINDSDSDAYITFDMDKFGHMSVYGQISGSHEEQFMKFKYSTDQTVLKNFVQLLKALL